MNHLLGEPKVTSTICLGIKGEMTLRPPWKDPATAESDAYSLFYRRASAMGWLTDAREGASGGYYGMNYAEFEEQTEEGDGYIAWFQVCLTEPNLVDRPLPIQPFFACVEDVLERMGTLQFDAIQLLLPVEGINQVSSQLSTRKNRFFYDNGLSYLMADALWFTDCDPQLKSRVQITLDSGENRSIHTAMPHILNDMKTFNLGIFTADKSSLKYEQDVAQLRPHLAHLAGFWKEQPPHRVTLDGTLVEWSFDAIGCFAAYLATLSALHGINTPLVLTVSRSNPHSNKA